MKIRPFGKENFIHLVAKLVSQCIRDWYGNWSHTTILKFGGDFGPGAVCDAVGACKFIDVLIGVMEITNCVENFISIDGYNFMTFHFGW